MQLSQCKYIPLSWFNLLLGFVCSLLLSIPVLAQRVDPAKVQMQEMDRRELQLNNMGNNVARPNDPRRSQALMEEISEDFERILTLHNEIVRAITANQSLSLQFISSAAAEIKKRSNRLQSTLQLKKPETDGDVPSIGEMSMNEGMALLCKQIENFVTNPIIEKPGTVDVNELERARKDLQSVVVIAGIIKKQADKQKRQ
jgi:hypothetical protein